MPGPLMIANTRVYRPDENREVIAGTIFHARDQREADALVRRGKAAFSTAEHIRVPAPLTVPPRMVDDEPAASPDPAPQQVAASVEAADTGGEPAVAGNETSPDSPAAPRKRGRYRRTDLNAED